MTQKKEQESTRSTAQPTPRLSTVPGDAGVGHQPEGFEWLDTPLGQTILTEENRLLEKAVRRMHGDTLLWSGVSPGVAGLSARSMVRQRIFAALPGQTAVQLARDDHMVLMRSRLDELPLRNTCVDALVMHHTLELAEDPRATLREAARVLQPGGQLLICAFNRFGAFSLCRALADVPRHYSQPGRVSDWLDVLGFEAVVAPEFALFRPPLAFTSFDAPHWDRPRAMLGRLTVPLGNLFVLHVRKKSLSIRPDWQAPARRRVALAGAAYPKLVDTRRKNP